MDCVELPFLGLTSLCHPKTTVAPNKRSKSEGKPKEKTKAKDKGKGRDIKDTVPAAIISPALLKERSAEVTEGLRSLIPTPGALPLRNRSFFVSLMFLPLAHFFAF